MIERPSAPVRLRQKIKDLFPHHQIYFRTDGKVRFFTLTTGMQLSAVAAVCLFSMWLGKSTFDYFAQSDRLQQSRMALNEMFGQVEALNDDMEGLENKILQRAARIEARQDALQEILKDGLIEPEQLNILDLSNDALSGEETPERAQKKAALKEAALRLRRSAANIDSNAHFSSVFETLEKRQVALVAALHDHAEQEKQQILSLLGDLKVNQETILARAHTGGADAPPNVGGPVVALASLSDDTDLDNDPLLALAEDWDVLKNLRGQILSVPAIAPLKNYYVSSSYGRRRDPFTRRWAHHSGTDLAAWYGTPVLATSDGTVTYAGYKAGYGRVVEVDHGNGFVTRYGHLRKVVVKKKQAVTMGDKLGETGSTGRSTGPHVHYEIWFDGKTLNPEKFIKASQNVLKIQGRTNSG
ncbi:MAG: peptidoglycan DD-metalloendopeptidase family protein [Pseudomonadota bacterium]